MIAEEMMFEVRHHRQIIDYVAGRTLDDAMRRHRRAYPDMADEVSFTEVDRVEGGNRP